MLHKAKYITKIDCTSGYWQIPLDEKSRKLTAFTTRDGRWQYKSLPMGITNAAPTFQKNMEIMLTGLLWKCCIVYIDDIIIYSNSFEEHMQHLEQVLERLKKVNITIKVSKCFFCRSEVEYLGQVVGNGMQRPTEYNVEKILQCKPPTTNTEAKQFCNLAGFYRRFIKNFADIAKPLTDLSGIPGKKVKIELSNEAMRAFEKIKEAIATYPILTLPDLDKPFGIRTDASDYAIGGVLFQIDEKGQEKPIAFGSRVLSKTEQRYSTTEREMLSVYHWIRHWRSYVWGTKFEVFTDHSPLRGIKTKKDITRRLTRWILGLQEYYFKLFYTPGKDNVVADALSRNPFANFETCSVLIGSNENLEALDPQDWLMSLLKHEDIPKRKMKEICTPMGIKDIEKAKKWFKKIDSLDDPFDILSWHRTEQRERERKINSLF